MLLDDAIIERAKCKGFLKKQGGKWKTWKNRFFVLDETALYYLESIKDRTPLGVIYLQGLVIEGAEQETKWKWSFSITTQSSTSVHNGNQWQERKYYIQAHDEKDYKMWLDALRNAVFVMKQAQVSSKDSPSSAHSHVRGSKPAPDHNNRLKHQSRSTDPTPSTTSVTFRQSSSPAQNAQPRRVYSAAADMQVSNRSVLSSSGSVPPPTIIEPTPIPTSPTAASSTLSSSSSTNTSTPSLNSSMELDPRANFRKSVFEKAVSGLFVQPSSEITQSTSEKDRKSVLRNLTQRGSTTVKSGLTSNSNNSRTDEQENMPTSSQRSPSPAGWEKASVTLFQDPSCSNSPRSAASMGLPADTTVKVQENSNILRSSSTIPSSTSKELHVLVAPWNDVSRETLFALLKMKATHPTYAKIALRVRIMASAIPDRTKEELISRGVEVVDVAWDDNEAMKNALNNINKVIFLPGYSNSTIHWAASILRATCGSPNKISQFLRVGVVGMPLTTSLGQWGQTVDTLFEKEGIVTTSVLVDQLYQEICPQQGRSSSTFMIPAQVANIAIAPVDSRDVAVLLAALTMGETPLRSSHITVAGPATFTYTQLMQFMNGILGTQLQLSPSPPVNAVLRELYDSFREEGGGAQLRTKNTEKIEGILGRPLLAFEAFLHECAKRRELSAV